VIQTRKAMEGSDQVVTLVDNETAVTNVSRMATRAGWSVNVLSDGEEFRIELGRTAAAGTEPLQESQAERCSGSSVLVISADVMGRGEPQLGNILLRGFLHTLGEVEPLPQTIVLFNTGVRLACEGSPVLDDLCALAAGGVDILVCGTCLGYFELTEKLSAGQVSNMYDIAETMLRADKVVTL
jgi:selenium metabolism protein YedF